MNKLFNLTVMPALLLTATINIAIAEVIDEIEKSFDVNPNANFALENINGNVEIVAWNKEQILVQAIVKAPTQKDRERIHVEISASSSDVDVITKYDNSGWSRNDGVNGEVKYSIKVPKSSSLDNITLVNGSLVIKDLAGEVSAELVNGSIKANGLKSNSEFSSVNGSISVSYDETGENLNFIGLESINGSIELYVPSNINAKVKAETIHGSINNDFDIPIDLHSVGKTMTGTIGSGTTKIQFESVNGSVKLKRN